MRCVTVLLALLAVLAMAFAVQHANEVVASDFELALEEPEAFLEVDAEAEAEEEALLEVDAEAETEVDAEAEVEAETEVDAETDVDAEAEAEEEADEEAEEEAEEEVEEEAEADSEAALVETESEDVYLAGNATTVPDLSQGIIVVPVAGMKKFGSTATKEDAYRRVIVSEGAATKPMSGWALREKNAPVPINVTSTYDKAFNLIGNKFWPLVNLTEQFKVREFSYVLIRGFGATPAEYFAPVKAALLSYGVAPEQIATANVKIEDSTIDNAAAVYTAVKDIFKKYKEQRIIVIAHGIGAVTFHATYALYPELAPMLHGLITLNAVWGGSAITNPAAMPEDAMLQLGAAGFRGPSSSDMKYASRVEFVRKYPIDFNALRLLAVASHSELPSSDLSKAITYITQQTKELNDGVSTIVDQLIPGGRCVILDKLDHNDLIVNDAKNPVDSILAAQAWIYTFFKST